MKLSILNYELEPDSNSTWKLSVYERSEKYGDMRVVKETYPKDLLTALLRIRENLQKKDRRTYLNLESFEAALREIDASLIRSLTEALEGKG